MSVLAVITAAVLGVCVGVAVTVFVFDRAIGNEIGRWFGW